MKLPPAASASLVRLFAFLVLSFVCLDARAAAMNDTKANKQIDDAINHHYASADIDKAEKKLLEVIKACASKCSASVTARAWMYVGIVRGSGRDDAAAAAEAFKTAKAA